jgi:hypothetical protein
VTLTDAMLDPARRERAVADGVRVVDEEVAAKRGLSGAALRAGYAAFCKLRPGITRSAVDRLLPLMSPALDRHWEKARAGGDPQRWFRDHANEVADDLLAVTDGLAERARNRVLLKLYRSLRGQARDHVALSVPRIPELLARHTAEPG